MNGERDDTFLARWLNDELTPEELTAFRESADYEYYRKIIQGTEALSSAPFDEESLLARVKAARPDTEKGRVIPLWAYGVAASVLLVIGFFVFFENETVKATDHGQQLAFELPDQSQVILNAMSEVVYDADDWNADRQLELSGEAYFRVRKGSTFTVKTDLGDVRVLGTEFNVLVVDGLLEVECYEGKVRVSYDGKEEDLLPGGALRVINGDGDLLSADKTAPAWISGQSSFQSMPLQFVLSSIERQYDVHFVNIPEGQQPLFTGSFPHDDLQVALRIVLGSVQIDYQQEGKTITLQKRK